MTTLLIRNGCLYPADASDQVIPGGAVLVDGERIVAVGPTGQVEAQVPAADWPNLQIIDARGKMILPGFVNAHWHDMFAMRLPFKGALRPASDRGDVAAFMAGGGDLPAISAAFDKFAGIIEALRPDEALAIARYSMWTQLRSGVTTLGDVGSLNRPEALLAAARQLGIRCSVSTWAGDTVCLPGESSFRRTRDPDVLLARIEGLILQCAQDDSGRVRARPSAVYGINMSDELGAGFADLVARHDVPFATHVGALRHESAAMQAYYGQSPVRRFAELGLLTNRFMAVHTAFADDGERDLLIAANAHISHSPAKYGGAGESSLSETRLIPQLRRAGLDVSVSTDGAALPIGGMAEAMRAAWQSWNEMSADPTEVLPTDALAMATRIGARGLDWGDQIGSLEPGKQADVVLVGVDDWRYLLNPRPLEAFLTLGGSHDVDTVIVAGQILLQAGTSTHLDEDRLQNEYLQALSSFSVRCLGIDPDLAQQVTRRPQKVRS